MNAFFHHPFPISFNQKNKISEVVIPSNYSVTKAGKEISATYWVSMKY